MARFEIFPDLVISTKKMKLSACSGIEKLTENVSFDQSLIVMFKKFFVCSVPGLGDRLVVWVSLGCTGFAG